MRVVQTIPSYVPRVLVRVRYDGSNLKRSMNAPRTRVAVLTALAIGFTLWFAASLFTAKREPWDGPAYWAIAYPLAIAACALLGYRFPERPWRWALVLFESQFLAMCLRNGELGNLWPIGMLLFAVVALPGVAAAHVAARFGRRSAEAEA